MVAARTALPIPAAMRLYRELDAAAEAGLRMADRVQLCFLLMPANHPFVINRWDVWDQLFPKVCELRARWKHHHKRKFGTL